MRGMQRKKIKTKGKIKMCRIHEIRTIKSKEQKVINAIHERHAANKE
jgi:hypothetical protein